MEFQILWYLTEAGRIINLTLNPGLKNSFCFVCHCRMNFKSVLFNNLNNQLGGERTIIPV
jgi:hypothetical protein